MECDCGGMFACVWLGDFHQRFFVLAGWSGGLRWLVGGLCGVGVGVGTNGRSIPSLVTRVGCVERCRRTCYWPRPHSQLLLRLLLLYERWRRRLRRWHLRMYRPTRGQNNLWTDGRAGSSCCCCSDDGHAAHEVVRRWRSDNWQLRVVARALDSRWRYIVRPTRKYGSVIEPTLAAYRFQIAPVLGIAPPAAEIEPAQLTNVP